MKVVFGAGDQGRVILDILRRTGVKEEVVFGDDDKSKHGEYVDGVEIIGGREIVNVEGDEAIVAYGRGQTTRLEIANSLANPGISFFSAIDQDATVSKLADIGVGVTVTAQSYVGPGAILEDHVLVDSEVNISHDTYLAEGVTVAPNVTLAGGVNVATNAYIGANATVINQSKIGEDAFVGAGAVVNEDVPPHTTVVGVPAEPINQ